ncbi:olfactory receptor 5B12-like [Ambystoma mexicanum]|uniref:olfactory receptor 5B12-like n=1 Tax=Ambystoma mexicanum TaxID=8296 RepID=UPI0037E84F4F
MSSQNQTTEFILLGLTNHPSAQIPLFLLFLVMYGTTLVCNGGMIALIQLDPRLWTPMYLFISHLSLVDLCYSTTVTPKMLVHFFEERNVITFNGCLTQLFFYTALGGTEPFLLAAMGYDRYVAICLPLRYTSIMTKNTCILLASACYFWGFLNASVNTGFILRLSFCASNEIQHFFCDYPPLFKLSCTETHINRVLLFVSPFMIGMFSTIVIIISYAFIFNTILRMRSRAGMRRAFSTCSSHFTAVTLFYGTVLFMYLRPSESHSLEQDMVVSVIYTVVIAMINPLIYSLRNQDVKEAARLMVKKLFSLQYL